MNRKTYIHVTDHALDRYRKRKKSISYKNAIRKIVAGIQNSRLIGFAKGNKREIREHRGSIYVCSYNEYKNRIDVITVLNSKAELRFDEDLALQSI